MWDRCPRTCQLQNFVDKKWRWEIQDDAKWCKYETTWQKPNWTTEQVPGHRPCGPSLPPLHLQGHKKSTKRGLNLREALQANALRLWLVCLWTGCYPESKNALKAENCLSIFLAISFHIISVQGPSSKRMHIQWWAGCVPHTNIYIRKYCATRAYSLALIWNDSNLKLKSFKAD